MCHLSKTLSLLLITTKHCLRSASFFTDTLFTPLFYWLTFLPHSFGLHWEGAKWPLHWQFIIIITITIIIWQTASALPPPPPPPPPPSSSSPQFRLSSAANCWNCLGASSLHLCFHLVSSGSRFSVNYTGRHRGCGRQCVCVCSCGFILSFDLVL